MPPGREPHLRLARMLPDLPRWVETRAMLLSGECEVRGLEEGDELSFIVCDAEEPIVSVVGRPVWDAIQGAVAHVDRGCDVLAVPENRSHVAAALRGWTDVTARLHRLGDAPRLPEVPEGSVRLLSPSEVVAVEGIGGELRSELDLAASQRLTLAAGLSDGRPVAFCYSGWETEGLWDISIDTLEEHRRQGHAARCVAYMVRHMRARGKEPVWCAEVTNEASMGLAAKLGFVPVDDLILFHPPGG